MNYTRFNNLTKFSFILADAVLLISLINLIQWYLLKTYLIKLSSSYVPMAPITSAFFILISTYTIFLNLIRIKKAVYFFAKTLLILMLLFCLFTISNYLFNLNIDIEKYLTSSTELLNKQPLGRMSPITGSIFCLISIFLLLYKTKLSQKINHVLNTLGFIILSSGFILLLGYLYKAPLLYASNIIPVSFLASLNFFLSGIVILSLLKINLYSIRMITKSKVGIRLTKTILPVVIIAVILNGILTTNVFLHFQNPTLISALLLIIVTLIVSLLIFRLSNSLGISIEQAAKKLKEKNEQYYSLNEEYVALNEELEEKVIKRTQELEEINQLLEIELANKQNVLDIEKELNQIKSQFISVVSHEFRTPIAGISSCIQLLQRYGSNWDDKKRIEMYDKIQNTLRFTNFLIDDVSLIGKDDLGKIPIKPASINFQIICNQVVSDVIAVYDYGVDINIRFGNSISEGITDERLLRHILTNLISNGVKYSDRKPIELLIENYENNFIQFTIKDNGIGIPKDDIKYIFTPFHRAENTHNIKGTGLGLSITKRCIDLLNGDINIESEVGKGTTVVFKIPNLEMSN